MLKIILIMQTNNVNLCYVHQYDHTQLAPFSVAVCNCGAEAVRLMYLFFLVRISTMSQSVSVVKSTYWTRDRQRRVAPAQMWVNNLIIFNRSDNVFTMFYACVNNRGCKTNSAALKFFFTFTVSLIGGVMATSVLNTTCEALCTLKLHTGYCLVSNIAVIHRLQ